MNFNPKFLDMFFVLFGALVIAWGSGATSRNVEITLIAFGGAIIGAALAFMSVRATSSKKRAK